MNLAWVYILNILISNIFVANEMEREKHEQSVEDRLLDALIYQAQDRSLPRNLTEIQFNFQMQSLAYDPSSAHLHARMQLMMHWQDDRLRWQPESYGQLTSFEHPLLQIWTPHLVILKYVHIYFSTVRVEHKYTNIFLFF